MGQNRVLRKSSVSLADHEDDFWPFLSFTLGRRNAPRCALLATHTAFAWHRWLPYSLFFLLQCTEVQIPLAVLFPETLLLANGEFLAILPLAYAVCHSFQNRFRLERALANARVASGAQLKPSGEQVVALLGLDTMVTGADRDVRHLIHALPLVAGIRETDHDGHNSIVEHDLSS